MSKRDKTKDELSKLAEIMVSKYQIDTILGTGDFLETALSEARRSNIQVSGQSIKKYEKDIAMKCKSLQGHVDYMSEQSVEEESNFGDDNDLYTYYGDVAEDSFIVQKAMEIMSRYLKGNQTTNFTTTQYIPDYSMFVEGEDGLVVIKGSYKGKTLDEIDGVNFKGAKIGWAKWCLLNDKNLTDDDRNVFNKIMMNQL
jgi:roadblock/LC7 domain-containing protein